MQPPRRAVSVPKELVAKYIREFCSRHPDAPRCGEGFITPYEILANRTGIDYSLLYKVARGTFRWNVSFDVADKIFCAIGDPLGIWRGDPELREIYEGHVVSEADRLKPIQVAA